LLGGRQAGFDEESIEADLSQEASIDHLRAGVSHGIARFFKRSHTVGFRACQGQHSMPENLSATDMIGVVIAK
jgi:hypothetical protein